MLGNLSIGIGALGLLFSVAWLGFPSRVEPFLKRLPRDRWIGFLITVVDLVWAAILLWNTPLGWFDAYKRSLFVLTPVAVFLVARFMDELLAARALGGFLLLLPAPVLATARWHPSAWRLVIVVLCYAWVIAGVSLVIAPYTFRKTFDFLAESCLRRALAAGFTMAVGGGLVVLGFVVY